MNSIVDLPLQVVEKYYGLTLCLLKIHVTPEPSIWLYVEL